MNSSVVSDIQVTGLGRFLWVHLAVGLIFASLIWSFILVCIVLNHGFGWHSITANFPRAFLLALPATSILSIAGNCCKEDTLRFTDGTIEFVTGRKRKRTHRVSLARVPFVGVEIKRGHVLIAIPTDDGYYGLYCSADSKEFLAAKRFLESRGMKIYAVDDMPPIKKGWRKRFDSTSDRQIAESP